MNRKLTRIPLLLGCLFGCMSTACSQFMDDRESATKQVVVERISNKPDLSPAERTRRYRECYGEGLQLVEQGRIGLALGQFEEAVAMNPSSPDALFNLGACHEKLGDPQRAINIYRAVLELTPNDSDCYANLGTSFIKMYYREKSPTWRKMAREAWRKSLELKPTQPDIRKYLAEADSGR
jgi:tetratricopeptide (TPR) repeat protein